MEKITVSFKAVGTDTGWLLVSATVLKKCQNCIFIINIFLFILFWQFKKTVWGLSGGL